MFPATRTGDGMQKYNTPTKVKEEEYLYLFILLLKGKARNDSTGRTGSVTLSFHSSCNKYKRNRKSTINTLQLKRTPSGPGGCLASLSLTRTHPLRVFIIFRRFTNNWPISYQTAVARSPNPISSASYTK